MTQKRPHLAYVNTRKQSVNWIAVEQMIYETKMEDCNILHEVNTNQSEAVFGTKYDFDLDGELRYVKPKTTIIDNSKPPPI